jgi:L-fucose isomerase
METGFFHLVPTLKALCCTTRQSTSSGCSRSWRRWTRPRWKRALAWFKGCWPERLRFDGKMLTPETLKTQLRLYLAMKAVQ